jgi:predicted flap endonuclease-1-like 5' DNA nuclease
MSHYLIELLIWAALAYLLGCCVGCLLRKLFGEEPAVEIAKPAMAVAATGAAMKAATPEAPVVRAPAPPPPVTPAAPLAAAGLVKPRGLGAARGGKADDLKRISGIGPVNEKVLHGLGIYHFDQIANWTKSEVDWVDDHLKFNGRIHREEWIRQARLLAEGNESEFARLYGTGGLGPKEAGERTVRGPREQAASAPATLMASDDDGGGKLERPKGIAKARGGKADDLQRISGVGPKNEKILHGLGFFHFDQIAAWTAKEVNWVDDHLRFGGRIRREEWIKQAKLLADGREEEFARQYGTGGLRNKEGEKLSGSRTRKS